jgi:hypothetical protein
MRANPLSARAVCGVLSLLACGVSAAPAPAQAVGKDLLEQVRRQNEVAAQKTEADVRDALAAAQKADPARAAEQLRAVLDRLEGDGGVGLSADRRETLLRLVRNRLKTAQSDAGKKEAVAAKGADRRITEARSSAEQDRIKGELARVSALQRAGDTSDAVRLARDLASRYPDLPAVQAAARNLAAAETLTSQRAGRPDTEARTLGVLASVSKAATPPKGDLEYDVPVWMKAVARKSLNDSPTTTTEKTILQALSSTIEVNYDGTRFDDVIQDLSDKLKIPLLLDKASLADAQVTSEMQVNFKGKASTRTVLKRILANFDLTYIIRDETVQVVSLAKARDSVVQKTFYVGHLLAGGAFEDAGIRFVPGLDAAQQAQNAQALIDSIKAIEPQSWQPNGPGSINYNPLTKSITIRQTAEFQSILGGSLR